MNIIILIVHVFFFTKENILSYFPLTANIRDIVDQMIYCVKKIEKEEGKESMDKMTLVDYQMLIMDIFGGMTDFVIALISLVFNCFYHYKLQ